MNYPCTGCGLCCKAAGQAVENAKTLINMGIKVSAMTQEVADFPYKFDSSGHCENLLPDNSCAVYENRPDICNVETTWKKHHAGKSKAEYFLAGMMLCNSMMIEAKADDKYLINIQAHFSKSE